MENVIKLLQENPNGAFATVDKGKPQVRPWQFQFAEDGRLYFGTSNTKEVFKQLQATPYAAFTSTSSNMITVRVRGAVTFIDDKG